ncbi:hypothetical protein FWJ25_17110 [Marinobacter salinexigens]|uniref:Uncharacterized protein n=1 Tax=Marinobacter salinexigens TaxID=2919747 RepID=A0A5B0V8Y6_9GAMM|nr:hypothetical protein [Marinobacter salinexigens]KAA1171126.1 hypothetical protein FWJ25_17110 [Marinobacter salinexigens]
MVEPQEVEGFSASAFRANGIGPLPESPRKRVRTGEELQPVGSYAGIIPYLGTIQDVEVLQDQEKTDPEFKSKDWWWDHQRIRFLNGKLGLKFLVLFIPMTWILVLWLGGPAAMIWATGEVELVREVPGLLLGIFIILFTLAWFVFAVWATPFTTNWLMSTGIGFLLKPFEKTINKKLDDTLEDGCSEFNRVTGQVRIAQGGGRYFEAPFVEFDAYVDRVIQQGGIFYRLILVHRYTQKCFHNTAFSSIESSKFEVLALWDVLQQYMDVSQPLPDTPRLEPFRHLDPVTAEHDKKTGRNPRYWRDLDLEAWKEGEGWNEVHRRQCEYPWGQRECKLTPKLGQIDMATYRKQRPATAAPI